MTVTLADVEDAAVRLDGVAHRTPVITARSLDAAAGATVFCKAENLQRAGAFKFRGAYNAIAQLHADERDRGIVTFSSGNHAQAVALAGRLLGVSATIFMPDDAPRIKRQATEAYGATVVPFDRYRDDRAALAAAFVTERGATLIPPFDDPRIIAGQGTAALELFADVDDLDVLVVPIGGGGLISGCATVAAARRPAVRVVGAEPAVRGLAAGSLRERRRVEGPVPRTVADGLQTTALGEHTFAIIAETVDAVAQVSEEAMVAAMRLLFERAKVVVEPSGACALAAVLDGRIDVAGKRVGVVLSGGNVDANRFAALMTGSETTEGQ
ncbi:MAG: pyridoxal-phosphate dependent enzyme [Nitriliruptoraceae bacterium]